MHPSARRGPSSTYVIHHEHKLERSACCNVVAMITFCIVIRWYSLLLLCSFLVRFCSDDACNFIMRSAFCRRDIIVSIISWLGDDAAPVQCNAIAIAIECGVVWQLLQWHHYNGSSFVSSWSFSFSFSELLLMLLFFLLFHSPSHRFVIINKLTRKKCLTCRASVALLTKHRKTIISFSGFIRIRISLLPFHVFGRVSSWYDLTWQQLSFALFYITCDCF